MGTRVLFVAEKRATLTVVKDRLKRVGLDHLLLDLYGADQKPKFTSAAPVRESFMEESIRCSGISTGRKRTGAA